MMFFLYLIRINQPYHHSSPSMKQFLLLFVSALAVSSAQAQASYTEKLRSIEPGKGKVVIKQSDMIEKIVNNTLLAPIATIAPAPAPHTESKQAQHETTHKPAVKPNTNKQTEHHYAHERKTNTKYVARPRHKANGYRICIFTGGNSRVDKTKAIQMGNKCREKFSELSVYTSFIAPRWVTHVGDFRTRQDAQKYVNLIRRAGFTYETRIVASEVNIPY